MDWRLGVREAGSLDLGGGNLSLVGTRIGNIRVEALIGRGGMGEVYRGRDEKLDRMVALKTLRRHKRVTLEARARFLREARLLSKLDHPGICRVYDLVEGDEIDCLILEYIEGQDLKRARDDMPALEDRLRVMARVADALAVAHERGIIHRDLKPENIMIGPDGAVKVLDFGVARMASWGDRGGNDGQVASGPQPPGEPSEIADRTTIGETTESGPEPTEVVDVDPVAPRSERSITDPDELASMTSFTRDGDLVGTVHYMSPEQARGEAVTPSSDLYSLGIVLRELVTGEHAYGPEQPAMMFLLHLVMHAQTRPLEGIPADLAQLIGRLTAADPFDRPNAREAADHLRGILEGPSRARRRLRTAVSVVAGVLLLIGAVAITARLSQPRPLLAEDQQGRVVLLPFANETGDPGLEWVEQGLMEMVAESLHETEGIEVVQFERVEQARDFLDLDPDAILTDDEAGQLARKVKAELVIDTTVTTADGEFTLQYRTWNVNGSSSTRRVVADELTEGGSEMGQRLALRLSPGATWIEIHDRYSEDPMANQLYAMGAHVRRSDGHLEARPYFQVCLHRDPDFVRAIRALANVEYSLGNREESRAITEELASRVEQSPDPRAVMYLAQLRGRHAEGRGETQTSAEYHLRCAELSARLQDRAATASALRDLGVINTELNQLDQAELALTLSRDLLVTLGDDVGVARTDMRLATVFIIRRDYDRAQEILEQALRVAEENDARHTAASCHRELGRIAHRRSDYETSLLHNQLSLQTAREDGIPFGVAIRLYDIARAQAALGRYEESEQSFEEALSIYRELEQTSWINRCVLQYLNMQLMRGDVAAAEQLLSEFDEGQNGQLYAAWSAARVSYARGEFSAALAAAERVRDQSGPLWESADQEALDVYRRAARDGRRYPLPHEPGYVSPERDH